MPELRDVNNSGDLDYIKLNTDNLFPVLSWGGDWNGNLTYRQGNMVRDSGYLMVANKTTEERAAPQPIGEPFYIYDGTIGTGNVVAKTVTDGLRLTPDITRFISGYRIHTVIGNQYVVYLVVDPLGSLVVTQLIAFTGTVNGWQEFGATGGFVLAGETVDVVVVMSEPDPTPTIWTGNWNYTTPQNEGIPASGVIVHSGKSTHRLDINYIDSDAGDRTTELQALTVGDIINGANSSWSIQNITDNGTYISFGVAPAVQGTPQGVQEFSFETVTPTPITHGLDTDYWLGSSQVRGLHGADTDYADLVPDDSQYSVDIKIQDYSVSEDWDLAGAP